MFAGVLDVFITSKNEDLIDGDSCRALRLTCKATKHVVDVHVKSLSCQDLAGAGLKMSSLPWPNLVKIDLGNGGWIDKDFKELQEVFDGLAALPLLKLQSLTVSCSHVKLLVQSNWPVLTELDLTINEDADFFGFSYPSDLEFPQFSLKKFELKGDLDIWVKNGEEGASKVAFLGPSLKSCPDLTHLKSFYRRVLF